MSELKPYKTGYMKPPKHGQFKKGKSGNPNGRPKQVEDTYLVLQKVLRRRVQVKNGNKKISLEEALIRRLKELALTGDRRAIQVQQKIIAMANELYGTAEPEVDTMAARELLAEMAGIELNFEEDDWDSDDR